MKDTVVEIANVKTKLEPVLTEGGCRRVSIAITAGLVEYLSEERGSMSSNDQAGGKMQ